MKITVSRDALLKPLQLVAGAIERRQTLPILSNVLISANEKGKLVLTATDLEVELIGFTTADEVTSPGDITVTARKLLDICRSLDESTTITLHLEKNRLILKSGKSRFSLSTLPAVEFPNIEETDEQFSLNLPQRVLKMLLENTHFAMAQQDVRYYLNGMLFNMDKKGLKVVATDGHRLSLTSYSDKAARSEHNFQMIIPRKGIMELLRLINADSEEEIKIGFGTNHISATTKEFTFISKLIEGKFPDYRRVIPKDGDKIAKVNREEFKAVLSRVSVLSNEKFRGIRLLLSENNMKVYASNPEQEEAEDEISIQYSGADLEIGFNVNYLLDICNTVKSKTMAIIFKDSNSSLLIEDHDTEGLYVIMPMRL